MPRLELEEGDALAIIYWAKNGTQCAAHALPWASGLTLFARPDYFPAGARFRAGAL